MARTSHVARIDPGLAFCPMGVSLSLFYSLIGLGLALWAVVILALVGSLL